MNRTIIISASIAAGILLVVKLFDYSLFTGRTSFEVYVGMIALCFTILGIWMGLKLTNPSPSTEAIPVIPTDAGMVGAVPTIDGEMITRLGISQREYEVLQLIAGGYSNQEIGERLFISVSTVKTHASNLFEKLDVKRRTQAIQKGKEIGILV